jgi:hypothetical protein
MNFQRSRPAGAPPAALHPPEAPSPKSPPPPLAEEITQALREHLGICNALLELAHKEAQALNSPAPFPARAIQVERKTLLSRLECALTLLARKRALWNGPGKQRVLGEPRLARLLQTALDTIMRVLVLDRENEQQLLRRGLLQPRCLPAAEQGRPHYVASLYQRHARR